MGLNTGQDRGRFRFSLKHMLATLTIAAVSLYLGMRIGQSLRPVGGGFSPDSDEFWLSWYHRGDESQRRTAIRHISFLTRKENPDPKLVKALRSAASNTDREIRLSAAAGLQYAAKTDEEARSVLQQLAEGDPDPDVRQRAKQALEEGIPLEVR